MAYCRASDVLLVLGWARPDNNIVIGLSAIISLVVSVVGDALIVMLDVDQALI